MASLRGFAPLRLRRAFIPSCKGSFCVGLPQHCCSSPGYLPFPSASCCRGLRVRMFLSVTTTNGSSGLGSPAVANGSSNGSNSINGSSGSNSRHGASAPVREMGQTFKVSRISYTNGKIETINLDTVDLMKTASIYARDLFFTLNLTSRQEQRQRGISVRRTVSAIQARKKKIILLSFGKVRAVAGLNDILLFDAHNPAVREFAHELRTVFQSGDLHGEPNELVFLECVLRDTVDSFHRRLRLFEPIGKSLHRQRTARPALPYDKTCAVKIDHDVRRH